MDLDEIGLRLAVDDLLARYCHGCDQGDLEMALGVFWPDATDQHGDLWDGNAQEFMRELIGRQQAARADGPIGPSFQHHPTSKLIKRDGVDEARVQTSFFAYIPHLVDAEQEVALIVGRFLDRVTRRDGVWKVAARKVINDFSDARAISSPHVPASWQQGGFLAGGYGEGDPGFVFMSE